MWIILLVKTNKQAPYVIYFQPKHRSLPISHLHYFIFLVWESLFLFVVFLLVVLRLPHCYCCISSSSTEIISLMIFDNPFLGLKWSLRTHSLPTGLPIYLPYTLPITAFFLLNIFFPYSEWEILGQHIPDHTVLHGFEKLTHWCFTNLFLHFSQKRMCQRKKDFK